jgi:hypothetical protein
VAAGTSGALRLRPPVALAIDVFAFVDLSEAQFIDSSTIKTIVTAKRAADTADRHFNLVLGTAAVVEMALELRGVLPELNHVETLDEALAAP